MALRVTIGIGLLSASVLAYQLVLMQVFSYTQWYHFASLVISLALLGFGTAGVLLSITRRSLLDRADRVIPLLMILAGFTMACAAPLSQTAIFRFDSYRVFVEQSHLVSLALSSVLLSLPFFFAALAIGLVFMQSPARIGASYFSNMLGSGLGAPAAILSLWLLPPHQLAIACGIGPLVAGIVSLPWCAHRERVLALLLVTGIGLLAVSPPNLLQASEYKGISRALAAPEARLDLRQPSPYGLVEVVTSPLLRSLPGLSLQYRNEVPVTPGLFSNGEWFGPAFRRSRADSIHPLDYSTEALPYVLGERRKITVLRGGTGLLADQALSRRAARVILVEPHAAALKVAALRFADVNDSLLFLPSVSVLLDDVRPFLASATDRQDAVLLPAAGGPGGDGGAHALREDYALTVEGLCSMWDLLSPDGVVSVSAWVDHPPRAPLKILATLRRVLEVNDIANPAAHLAAVRSWGMVTFVMTRQTIGREQSSRIRRFCRSMLFDPLLLPDIRPEEQNYHNRLRDTSLFAGVAAIVARDLPRMAGYPFRIEPATDDRPFFFQFLHPGHFGELRELLGLRALPFFELGYVIHWLTVAILAILALGLLVVPTLRNSRSVPWVAYFGALGAGYIFVEMTMIQKLVLLVGHPVYAAGGVLCAMLGASGAGSMISGRLNPHPRVLRLMSGAVAAGLIAYALVLDLCIASALSWPVAARILAAGLVIVPVGFLMGFPFPLGIRYLANKSPSAIPLAWGANGFFSVVGAPLATIVAVEGGFTLVFVSSALCYAVACTVPRSRG